MHNYPEKCAQDATRARSDEATDKLETTSLRRAGRDITCSSNPLRPMCGTWELQCSLVGVTSVVAGGKVMQRCRDAE